MAIFYLNSDFSLVLDITFPKHLFWLIYLSFNLFLSSHFGVPKGISLKVSQFIGLEVLLSDNAHVLNHRVHLPHTTKMKHCTDGRPVKRADAWHAPPVHKCAVLS